MDAPDEQKKDSPPNRVGRRVWLEAALIGLLALVLNLAGNGQVSLWDRDEPRYAGCTREMRQSGDWIHPTFNDEPRYHKPVLIYWLMLAGTAIGGDNPFGARLVSSVAGVVSCLVTWAFGRRFFGPVAGRWAALAMATAPIVIAESKLATTDATLLVWFLGAQWGLWELSERPSRRATAIFWISMAGAVLTKGPIGPALLVASGALNWWFGGPMIAWRRLLGPLWPDASGLGEGRRMIAALSYGGVRGLLYFVVTFVRLFAEVLGRWLLRNWGFLLCLAIILPWYVAIGIQTKGEFYSVAWGYHVIKRATEAIETHGGFPGYYVLLTIPLLFPWSALLPAGLAGIWKIRRKEAAAAFLLAWIVGPLLLLESVRTKIIHYYLPAYPACAIVVGWLIASLSKSDTPLKRWRLGGGSIGMLAGIGLALTVAAFAGVFALPGALRWPCLVASIAMGAGTLWALIAFRDGAAVRAATGLAVSWSLTALVLFAWFLPTVQPYRLPQKVAVALAMLAEEQNATPVLVGFKPPGIVYELGHAVPVLEGMLDADHRAHRDGPLVAALTEPEIDIIRSHPRLDVEKVGQVEGFNIERFANETLTMALIKSTPNTESAEDGPLPSIAQRPSTKPSFVK